MITADDLKSCTLRLDMHLDGARGMVLSTYTCEQHPRLTVSKSRKDRTSAWVVRLHVDGQPVADREEAARRLNEVIEAQILPFPSQPQERAP